MIMIIFRVVPVAQDDVTNLLGSAPVCRGTGLWRSVPGMMMIVIMTVMMMMPGMDPWCRTNCGHTPPNCPASHCRCD